MINSLQEPLKDTNIPWIGEIPQSWSIVRIKNVAWLKGRIGWQGLKSDEYQDTGAYLITGTDFDNGKINWDTCVHITQKRFEEAPEIHIKENDLLITKDGTVGKVALALNCPQDVSLNSGVLLIRNTKEIKYHSKYLYYVLLSDVFWNWFTSNLNGNSTIIHLYQEQFYNFSFCFPSYIEQKLIANYLDKKCSEIDKVVETEKLVIEKLKEYKQSVITEAVTKGIDKSVPLKNSGIEWIGKIPQNWEVSRFKFLGKFTNGYAFPSDSFTENGIKVMKITNIQPMQISWEDCSYISDEWKLKAKDYIVPQNALVFALTRPIISGGIKVSIYEDQDEVLLNQRNAMFNGNNKIITSWLYYIMLNKLFIQEFNMKIDRTGQQPNISTNEIANIYITVPNINEQKQIVSYLDKKCSDIDKAIADKEQIIEKLSEYKKSLIYECVTGKKRILN